MCIYMDKSQQEQYEEMFKRFDADRDGKISARELQQFVKTTGGEMSLEEAEAVVRSSDEDGDGLLALEEFSALMEGVVGGDRGVDHHQEEMREAFRMYANAGDEESSSTAAVCITPRSLKRVLSRLGDKRSVDECQQMIAAYDLDADGVLSFDEFKLIIIS
ncbi:hypothetical protein Ancab_027019 [Ancistrocladus abbreviatus]